MVNHWLEANELHKQGYRCISNRYCMIGRVDREDWLDVLARQRRCSRADFYNVDGSGIGDQHVDFYVRVHTQDKKTVSEGVYKELRKLFRGY